MNKLFLMIALAAPASALAQEANNLSLAAPNAVSTYKVTVTNLTIGQVLSPPLLATHSSRVKVFDLGQPARPGVALIAEDGKTATLKSELMSQAGTKEVVVGAGGIQPGKSATYRIKTDSRHPRLSIVTMLVSTNDGFTGLSGELVNGLARAQFLAPGYDAGSERNSESCRFVPGAPCSAHDARDTEGAEGFVSIHPGIHGQGDVPVQLYDWRNPVARVTVVRE